MDSCEWIFHLFGRHHCKSRIFERMENFQNDCCHPCSRKPFKNSYSRQLRIVNAVVWPPASQINWTKSVFPQTKATHFETMMTTVDEVNRDETKVPDFFSQCFACLFYCWTRWVNWFTIDVHVSLLLKLYGYIPVYKRTIASLFYVLIRYSLLFSSEIILKQLFASGSVNIVE